ncbi:serine/threonine-protein kinase [Amycolatopsis cihanbeyliensis]|uniref:non-specific serine/threonine protein kinase n=1 Tax=Amycolatopsis cihanbeyliensis TaxID=1128664 RepID=A0A542DD92_AMYCI|nr:serine/threonine-protein kinase [Amycolatopsis cihanbeyliensis]TQJ01038.1 serine/threonine protein kinase [Amycolatopsis cihanbeyliensis]
MIADSSRGVGVIDTGQLIAGHYRLVEHIGSGAMGVVWRAIDERLERSVAVKQILTQPGLSEAERANIRQRAMREAKNAARFQHPNAIVVFDIAEHAGDPCLVMEYLPSQSLSAILAERPMMPVAEVAAIGKQVAAALVSAHRAGLVHRDVKPGNVLIDESGTAKITDFGISRAAGDMTLTQTGLIGGTPAYLAPELARGADPAPSSDVFALGATLYHAIEGQTPYGNNANQLALLYSAANGKIIPPSNAGPATALLMNLLRTDPEERPSMAEARDQLAALATGGAGGAAGVGGGNGQKLSETLVSPPLPHTGRKPAEPASAPPPQPPVTGVRPPWQRAERPAAPPPTSSFTPERPAAAPAPAPASGGGGAARRKPLLIGAIAAVVVVAATVLTIVLSSGGDEDPGSDQQAQNPGTTATGAPDGSQTSGSPSSPAGAPGTTPSQGTVDESAAYAQVKTFLDSIGTATAWEMLTPAAQSVYVDLANFTQHWSDFALKDYRTAREHGSDPDGAINVSYEIKYKDEGWNRSPVRVIDAGGGKLLIDSDTRRPSARGGY